MASGFAMAWLLALLGMTAIAAAELSDSFDIELRKEYGNCHVWTQVHWMTDERSYHLECKQTKGRDVTGVEITLHRGQLTTLLNKGVIVRFAQWYEFRNRIPVAIRIDDATPIEDKWQWDAEAMRAFTTEENIAVLLLDQLPSGRRIVIRVGKLHGRIYLKGSLAAVKDFRARIKDDPRYYNR